MKRSNSYSRSPVNKKNKSRSHRSSDLNNSERSTRREHTREKRDSRRNGKKSSPRKQHRVRSSSNNSTKRNHRDRSDNVSPRRRNSSRNSDSDNDFQTISVSNLNDRISDEEIRDVMYKEFNQYDKFTVKVTSGNGIPRVVYIQFRCPGDARHARKAKSRLKLFGLTVRVDPIYGTVQQRHRSPHRIPPQPNQPIMPLMANIMQPPVFQAPPVFHHTSNDMQLHQLVDSDIVEQTRTVMVTGLDPAIGQSDVHAIFSNFGAIENITIRRDRDRATGYVTYYSVDMSRTAKIEMSGRSIGSYRCRAVYAKSPPTNCLWIGGLGNFVTGERLEQELDRFAVIRRIEWPPDTLFAYVLFDCVDAASAALNGIRGVLFRGNQLRVDYVNPQNVDILRPYVNELRRNASSSSVGVSSHSSRSRPRERRNHEAPPRRSHQEPPSRVRQANERRAERKRSSPSRHHHRRKSPGYGGRRPRDDHPANGGARSRSPTARDTNNDDNANNTRDANNSRHRSHERSTSRESGERRSSSEDMQDEDDDDILRSPTPVDIAQRPPSPPPGSCHSELSPDEEEEEPAVDVDTAKELVEVARLLPVVWSGVISLKSSDFGTMMHLISGCVDVVDNLMRDHTTTEMARVRITHRLRLDDCKLKDIERRIADASDKNLSILLALPNDVAVVGGGGDAVVGSTTKPLANLVDYLRNKHAAGVISVDTKHSGSIIHTFPPCPFADKLIMNRAHCVRLNPAVDNYIVVVVIKGDEHSN